jgi:4-hydroxy-tetrahydrodipicolinate synthase
MNPDELRSRLHGAMTALVTPFKDGTVDREALRTLVEWQIEQCIAALVPCGTTGEAPTLSFDERVAVIRVCVEAAAGRVPIIAGTGTNSTQSTVALTAAARSFGADAALIVTPYYSRPTQEGIFRHFQSVARQVDLPIIVYNVPARTAVDIAPVTLERLAAIPAIVGIKDATGDLARPMAVTNQFGERFVQLSGHDATAFGFNTMGGSGTISVVSNVAPRLCVDMHDACRRGDVHAARAIHKTLRPLVAALELETNPVPVKYALHLLGLIRPDVRLPLVPVLPETAAGIAEALRTVADVSSPQSRAA